MNAKARKSATRKEKINLSEMQIRDLDVMYRYLRLMKRRGAANGRCNQMELEAIDLAISDVENAIFQKVLRIDYHTARKLFIPKKKTCATCCFKKKTGNRMECIRHAPRIMDANGRAVFPIVRADYRCFEYTREQKESAK